MLSTLPLLYCMFMLNCFNDPTFDSRNKNCPTDCSCYTAPYDGNAGNDANSYVCNGVASIFVDQFWKNEVINTLVLKSGDFNRQEYSAFLNDISTTSVVLCQFSLSNDPNSIFQKFDNKQLKYITMWNSKLYANSLIFDWSQLSQFQLLQALYIEQCTINELDSHFGNISPKIETIIIIKSGLSYIDPQAFYNKKSSLKKLIISGNLITNLIWLTSLQEPFKRLKYVDLSGNHLNFLPENLIDYLPEVSVLYLEGNKFMFFSENSIKPWLGINEFRLLSHLDNSLNTLYFTTEMSWLITLQDLEIDSIFLVDSLVNHVTYQCSDENVFPWHTLDLVWILDYYPGQISLDEKLYHRKPNRVELDINGISLWKYPECFSKSYDPEVYQSNRNFLIQSTSSTLNDGQFKDYIRLSIFDKDFVDYFLGITILSNVQIQSTINQVVDLLDVLYKMDRRALFVLWRSEHLDFVNWDFSSEFTTNQFKETVLKPLLNQIKHHPALLGIEITDTAFSKNIAPENMLLEPEATNTETCPYSNDLFTGPLKQEIQFINYIGETINEFGGQHLYSVGLSANCLPCFIISTVPNCLQISFNYLTIISDYDEQSEYFHYKNVDDYYDKWFSKHSKQVSQPILYVLLTNLLTIPESTKPISLIRQPKK